MKIINNHLFSDTLPNNEIKWVLECISYVQSLNIPISDNIYFKHCKGFIESGWCNTGRESKKAKCTVAISKYLNLVEDDEEYEKTFKNTCIHELIHTIKNTSKNPHKGSWKKYADIINSDGKYEITELFSGKSLRIAKSRYILSKLDEAWNKK